MLCHLVFWIFKKAFYGIEADGDKSVVFTYFCFGLAINPKVCIRLATVALDTLFSANDTLSCSKTLGLP
jgi:hypothetical protein